MDRYTEACLERSCEVAWGEIAFPSQPIELEVTAKMVHKNLFCSPLLPRSQSPTIFLDRESRTGVALDEARAEEQAEVVEKELAALLGIVHEGENESGQVRDRVIVSTDRRLYGGDFGEAMIVGKRIYGFTRNVEVKVIEGRLDPRYLSGLQIKDTCMKDGNYGNVYLLAVTPMVPDTLSHRLQRNRDQE